MSFGSKGEKLRRRKEGGVITVCLLRGMKSARVVITHV